MKNGFAPMNDGFAPMMKKSRLGPCQDPGEIEAVRFQNFVRDGRCLGQKMGEGSGSGAGLGFGPQPHFQGIIGGPGLGTPNNGLLRPSRVLWGSRTPTPQNRWRQIAYE